MAARESKYMRHPPSVTDELRKVQRLGYYLIPERRLPIMSSSIPHEI